PSLADLPNARRQLPCQNGSAQNRHGARSFGRASLPTRRTTYLLFFKIFMFAGRVNRSSFRSLLTLMLSAYISKIFSPLRSRSTAKGHITPPPTSRYLENRVTSMSHCLSDGLRRL